MMYPYMTLNDDTEITHSEMKPDGRVKVFIETPDLNDKTEMIMYLNSVVKTKQKYVSVLRPRRFGKTMAADMICAYYDRKAESRELFANRKLAGCEPYKSGEKEVFWDEYLGKFDVIRLVMTKFIKK